MIPIEIRAARAADASQITGMIEQLSAHHNDTAQIDVEELIFLCFGPKPWLSLLVAERGSVLIGYAALQRKTQLQFARRLMDVQHLFVKAHMRGIGVGRGLIEAAAERARDERCEGVTLGVMAQNTQAQEFFQRIGFERRETSGAVQLMRALDLRAVGARP